MKEHKDIRLEQWAVGKHGDQWTIECNDVLRSIVFDCDGGQRTARYIVSRLNWLERIVHSHRILRDAQKAVRDNPDWRTRSAHSIAFLDWESLEDRIDEMQNESVESYGG